MQLKEVLTIIGDKSIKIIDCKNYVMYKIINLFGVMPVMYYKEEQQIEYPADIMDRKVTLLQSRKYEEAIIYIE